MIGGRFTVVMVLEAILQLFQGQEDEVDKHRTDNGAFIEATACRESHAGHNPDSGSGCQAVDVQSIPDDRAGADETDTAYIRLDNP